MRRCVGGGTIVQVIGRRAFWPTFILLNLILIGVFVYAVLQQPALLTHTLPGTFGPDLSPAHTGNMLALAILFCANAVLILGFGLVGSKARLLLGIVLLILALPVFCVTYTQATPTGTPLLEIAGTPIANYDLDAITVLQFTGDQLAGALLLDAPEIFHWRFTNAETAIGNTAFGISIFLFRALIGLGVLVLLLGKWRSAKSPALTEAAATLTAVETAEALHNEPVQHKPAVEPGQPRVEPAFAPAVADEPGVDEAAHEPTTETPGTPEQDTPEQDEHGQDEQVPAEPTHDDGKHAQTESEHGESEPERAEAVQTTEPAEAEYEVEAEPVEAEQTPTTVEDAQGEPDHKDPLPPGAQAENHVPDAPDEPGEPEKEHA